MKLFAICFIAAASLAISKSSSAQIRLGAASTNHLTTAASVNTPSIGNALRASSSAAVNTTSKVKTNTVATTRQIKGKTTTAVNKTTTAADKAVGKTEVDADVNADVKVSAQKQ